MKRHSGSCATKATFLVVIFATLMDDELGVRAARSRRWPLRAGRFGERPRR